MVFALCASVAFGQTARISRQDVNKAFLNQKKAINLGQRDVNYKASIFTKDATDDTLYTFTFADVSDITYGAQGKINSSDRINDTLVANAAHGPSSAKSFWYHIPDTEWVRANFATTFPGCVGSGEENFIMERMYDEEQLNDNNGFMFLSLSDVSTNEGYMNCYVGLPAKPNSTQFDAAIITVGFYQAYIKYANRCYLDYKVNGNWYAQEINVTGVDVQNNGAGIWHYTVTLPLTVASENQIEIRVRNCGTPVYNGAPANRYFYGWFWAIDNVSIVAHPAGAHWKLSSAAYVDGFYGTMPMGMNIPMSYIVDASNAGTEQINNIKLTVQSAYENEEGVMVSRPSVLTQNQPNLPFGRFDTVYALSINERGIIQPGYTAQYIGAHGWLGHWNNVNREPEDMVGSYGRKGLPVDQPGKNLFAIAATPSASLPANYKPDTIAYYVSDIKEVDEEHGITVSGYRWAHDNGAIPSNSEFTYQLGEGLVSQSGGHQYEAGYQVNVRYVTGDEIPLDDQNEPWVFRGLELIVATTPDIVANDGNSIEGVSIHPLAYRENFNAAGDSYSGANIGTGVENALLHPTAACLNDSVGVIIPGQDYSAFNILFPDQPAMKPNTPYHFGYSNYEGGLFALAQVSAQYRGEEGEQMDTLYGYGSSHNPALNDYRRQFSPESPYDMGVYDPNDGDEGGQIQGWSISNYPMIRVIVGPKDRTIPLGTVETSCERGNGEEYYIEHNSENVCDSIMTPAVGTTQAYYIVPGVDEEGDTNSHAVIDTVYINDGVNTYAYYVEGTDVYLNGELQDPDDCIVNGHDYSIIWSDAHAGDQVLLERYYYTVMFKINSTSDYVKMWAHAKYVEHNPVGIDPVAPEVRMSLSPNPATSQVRLNIAGLSGKVNCSIIDMSGRTIYNREINAEVENNINLNNVPAGAYFVRITNDTFSKIEKLIVR